MSIGVHRGGYRLVQVGFGGAAVPVLPWQYETLAMRLARHFHHNDVAPDPCALELAATGFGDMPATESVSVAAAWVLSGSGMFVRGGVPRGPLRVALATPNDAEAGGAQISHGRASAGVATAVASAPPSEADGIAAVDAVKRRYECELRPRIETLLQMTAQLVDGSVPLVIPWLRAAIEAIDRLKGELHDIAKRFSAYPTPSTYAHIVRHNTLAPLGTSLMMLQLKMEVETQHLPWVAWLLPAFGATPRLLKHLADAAMGPVRVEAVRRGIKEEPVRLEHVQLAVTISDAQAEQLLEVFRNLATNGIVHGWEGRADEFDLTAAEAQRRFVRLSFKEGQLVYEDNGQGIPPEVIDAVALADWTAIAQRSQTRGTGSGLGLEHFVRTMDLLGWSWSFGPRSGGGTRIVCTPNPEDLAHRPAYSPGS
ncbi:MAG: ATP-binding protein [Deltaproteobacteria bacterium]|nr:ATP-binding protein [Deltaproteobacteria bacterium]